METKTLIREDQFPQLRDWGVILWSSPQPVRPEDIRLQVVIDNQPVLPPETQDAINTRWTKTTARNGDMLGLIRVDTSTKVPTIFTKLTDYKHHIGTNLDSLGFLSLQSQPDLLANGLVSSTLIITSDNKLILGQRADGRLGVIGGSVNTDENWPMTTSGHLFLYITDEIKEELGWQESDFDISQTGLSAIIQNNTNLRPLLLFRTSTVLTSNQMQARFLNQGNKDEHSKLFFLENSPSAISSFLNDHSPSSITPATSDALNFHLEVLSKEISQSQPGNSGQF